jgi:biopolymer transport protein ExbD
MINVVLLLLIFFMLAGRLENTDSLNISPPQSAAYGEQPLAAPVVSVTADGRVGYNGQWVDLRALAARVTAEWRAPRPPEAVVMRADANAKSGRVMDVVDALRGAGVGNIELLTVSTR